MEIAAVEAWSDLFVAAAGASAALAGLVFVAVSINLDDILEYQGLPPRALVTLLLLMGVLVVSLFCLVPGQSVRALGYELLVQSVLWTSLIGTFAVRSLPEQPQIGETISRFLLPAFGTIPYPIGSIVLITGSENGLYWVFAGLIGATVAAVMNAWVLLVEIRR